MISIDRDSSMSIQLSNIKGNEVLEQITNVIEKKNHCFIIENEEMLAAIIPIEDYNKYKETVEDFELLTIAVNRMQNFDSSKTISHEDALKELGISEKDLENVEVDIE